MSHSSAVSPELDNAMTASSAADHAEIAVAGLPRMDPQGRRAGGSQRRRDLPRDMAALAHAGDDDPAGDAGQHIDRAGEAAVKPGGQIHQRIGFHAQHTLRHRDVTVGGDVDLRLGTERPVGIDRMVQGRRTPKSLTGRNLARQRECASSRIKATTAVCRSVEPGQTRRFVKLPQNAPSCIKHGQQCGTLPGNRDQAQDFAISGRRYPDLPNHQDRVPLWSAESGSIPRPDECAPRAPAWHPAGRAVRAGEARRRPRI